MNGNQEKRKNEKKSITCLAPFKVRKTRRHALACINKASNTNSNNLIKYLGELISDNGTVSF